MTIPIKGGSNPYPSISNPDSITNKRVEPVANDDEAYDKIFGQRLAVDKPVRSIITMKTIRFVVKSAITLTTIPEIAETDIIYLIWYLDTIEAVKDLPKAIITPGISIV